MTNPNFAHMLDKARDAAAGGINAMSTGEALAAALVLNRPDWLAAQGYTIPEAIDRIGPEWANLVPAVAREFERDVYAAADESRAKNIRQTIAQISHNEVPEFAATVVTYSEAPGYRDVSLTLDVEPIDEEGRSVTRMCIRFNATQGATVAEYIIGVHRRAWRRSEGSRRPLDAASDEQRPLWLGDA